MRIIAVLVIFVGAVVFLEDLSGPGGLKFSKSGTSNSSFSSSARAAGGVTSAGTNAARNIAQ